MRALALLAFILPTACTSQPSEDARRAACDAASDLDAGAYSVADTGAWRVGDLPLWATPDEVRAAFGTPDSTFQELPWTDALRVTSYGPYGEGPLFRIVADSVAFPVHLAIPEGGGLDTDRGRLEVGATAAEVSAVFPESYACRNWPLGASVADTSYDTELFIDDVSDRGRVVLWLREGGLTAVGVWEHWPSDDLRRLPRE